MENQNQNGQHQQQPQTQLQQLPEGSIVDSTLRRISEMQAHGELKLPNNYSAENALKAAWLILQEDGAKKLQCTKESIALALLGMVIQGLNPMKRQCSFIPYGNKLTLQREYQGAIAVAKRAGLKHIVANPIWKGDAFTYEVDPESGRKRVIKHDQDFMNIGGELLGAYAIRETKDGVKDVEIMNMNQIRQAWQQGATKGASPAHKNFPDQMACKTVIGRALKSIINSSDDSALFEEDDQVLDAVAADVDHQITTKANRTEIGFEEDIQAPATVQPKKEPTPQPVHVLQPAQQPAYQPEPVHQYEQQPSQPQSDACPI